MLKEAFESFILSCLFNVTKSIGYSFASFERVHDIFSLVIVSAAYNLLASWAQDESMFELSGIRALGVY